MVWLTFSHREDRTEYLRRDEHLTKDPVPESRGWERTGKLKKLEDDTVWIDDLAVRLEIKKESLALFCRLGLDTRYMYRKFTIPKKGGGFRSLSEPYPPLKEIQRRVYEKLLRDEWHHASCFGFRPGRSIRDNAALHVGQDMVIKLDLKDFFTTISTRRVQGILLPIVGSKPAARLLTNITTVSGVLPQGAPTSPALANLACRRLDARMEGLAAGINGGKYSRYADDLTLSGTFGIKGLLPMICQIIHEEGWKIAEEKTRIMPYWQRQKVTGLVVNTQVGAPREYRRNLKAALNERDCKRSVYWQGRRIPGKKLDSYVAFAESIRFRME